MDTKTKRKLEILKASIHLMYLKGYNGTSVKDITVAAGIPKGSFYNYFTDKENYAVEAIRYYYTINSDSKFSILEDENLKPLTRIKVFFEQSIMILEENGLKLGCFVGNLSQEMGDVNDNIADATAAFYSKVIEVLEKNLKAAKVSGELKSEITLGILASFIVSAWQGSLLRMKVSRSKTPLLEFMVLLKKELLI